MELLLLPLAEIVLDDSLMKKSFSFPKGHLGINNLLNERKSCSMSFYAIFTLCFILDAIDKCEHDVLGAMAAIV